MTKKKVSALAVAAALVGAAFIATASSQYVPGKRSVMHAHNAFPVHEKFHDRLDRALSGGLPVVIELDTAWFTDVAGKSTMVLSHGAKLAAQGDPTMEDYVIPRLKPIVEKALKDGNKGNWPLVTLYFDIQGTETGHLAALSKLLDEYDTWWTFAKKPADETVQAPLELKPAMAFIYDKNDVKRKFFYDPIAVGGKVRVFGSVQDPQAPAGMTRQEGTDWLSTVKPEDVLSKHADTYRRWFFMRWNYIEKGGQLAAGEWTMEEQARLGKFVDRAHNLGYFVSTFCLNGYSPENDGGQELDKAYNLGSREAVELRWKAAIRARMDFIQTDHYEDLAKFIKVNK